MEMEMQPPTQPPWSSWQRWVNSRRKLMERLQSQFARVPVHDSTHSVHWSVPEHVIYVPNHIRYEGIPYQGRKHTWNFVQPPTLLPPSLIKAIESKLSDMRPPPLPLDSPPPPPLPQPRARAPGSTVQWRDVATATLLAVGVLLFVLLLAVRLIDKYYDLHLFKVFDSQRSRRRQREWQSPPPITALDQSVLTVDTTTPFPGDHMRIPADALSVDLPPPYSECAPNTTEPIRQEDPPPPYSSCLVSFTNSKDGTPTVHFYDSHRKSLFADTHTNSNVGESSSIDGTDSNSHSNSRTNEERNETENLVFENGRGIERNDERDLHITLDSDIVSRSRNDENRSSVRRDVVV